MQRTLRVLVAKLGLDAHTIGVTVLARAMRDAGMEVIYSGLRQTPEMVVQTAIQEDVDVVGLSILSGAHMQLFPRIRDELTARGKGDVLLVGGGIIPHDDMGTLEENGFAKLFGPGTKTTEIATWIEDEMTRRFEKEGDEA